MRRRPFARRNAPLLAVDGSGLAHGLDCVVTALSPSDAQFEMSLRASGLVPELGRRSDACPINCQTIFLLLRGYESVVPPS